MGGDSGRVRASGVCASRGWLLRGGVSGRVPCTGLVAMDESGFNNHASPAGRHGSLVILRSSI